MKNAASIALLAIPGILFAKLDSGLKPGEFVPAFEPHHATGPDRGTDTCPVCKYTVTPAVQIWVNNDSWENIGKIASNLETQIGKYGSRKLKAFVVYLNPTAKEKAALTQEFEKFAEKYKLRQVALTFVDSPKAPAVEEYAINTDSKIKNTVLIYSQRKVTEKFVNFNASNLSSLDTAVAKAISTK